MDTTYADLRDGERHDIIVAFVSRRSLEGAGTTVYRLRVRDRADTPFSLLITPAADSLLDLKTGASYRIDDLLACTPVDHSATTSEDCPDCGMALRSGQPVDTAPAAIREAASSDAIEGLFGVVDTGTTVTNVERTSDAVDDWEPMVEDEGPVDPPTYVCEDCGETFGHHDLHPEDLHDAAADEMVHSMAAEAPASETVGLAAAGAKDVGNFRANVEEGYTPQPEAIADEGLFYDYYFETGDGTHTEALFAPRYATAASTHPITGEPEQFLSVGLDSTLSVEDFERPRLDLVAVLDVSGSMNSPFDQYYYDEQGNECPAETDGETKLAAAIRSLQALTEQLRDEDRLGIVLYNHRAHVAKPLRDVGSTDMDAIRGHIAEIAAEGSTNMADGFEAAVDMLAAGPTDGETERRVVFMTDMMPNTGPTGESELTALFADAAADGIHTTFVGIGLDHNADLADAISGIRGANHYFVHSSAEFEQRLADEFAYMVTPLVYDLGLDLDAEGVEIAAVHGSPSADPARDRLIDVGTLFPSPKSDGEARGGVVLVRLADTTVETVDLVAAWTERGGDEHVEEVTVELPTATDTYDHSGIRKAVGLSRYARELRAWAREVHQRASGGTGVDDWLLPDERGHHERESVPLVVPEEYVERFQTLREYLQSEMAVLDEETLQQELDLLATLCEDAPRTTWEVAES